MVKHYTSSQESPTDSPPPAPSPTLRLARELGVAAPAPGPECEVCGRGGRLHVWGIASAATAHVACAPPAWHAALCPARTRRGACECRP